MQSISDWLQNPDNFKTIVPIIAVIVGTILTFIIGLGNQFVCPAFKEWRKRRRKRAIPAGNFSLLTLAPGSIDKYPKLWKQFHIYPLPEPDDNAIVSLLKDRVDKARMLGKEADYPQIARKNDRTFRNIIENLKTAQNRNLTVEAGQYEGILQPRDGQIQGKTTPKLSIENLNPTIVLLLSILRECYIPDAVASEYLKLGNSLFWLSRYEEAITSYDKAIEFKLDYYEAWYGRGIALGNLGRADEAIASYDRAIEFKPDNYEAWYGRGVALANLGRDNEAIAGYQQALKIQPQSASTLYNLACVYALHGDIENSLAFLRQAIQIEPGKYIDLDRQDEDFRLLRQDPRFISLVS